MKEFVIKQGFYEQFKLGIKQPGLHLTRIVLDILGFKKLISTTNCCDYTVPTSALSTFIFADNHIDAGTKGVNIGQMFATSSTNTLGVPEGVLLVRIN